MDNTRREFLKKVALLSGGATFLQSLPPVIQKALAINPDPGSTFYDAEHIVFLMQENRSFDHQLGTLQGVRGFNDPRAIRLPNKNPVWLQSNDLGDTYAPFHLNVKDTKVAWMGSLPHGWTDQTDATNNGKHDKWLETKKARNKSFGDMPLTMGYCERSDFPFYYSLADAFTVCDHNFCSSLTGTHPNRHYWMTGTVRETNQPEGIAHLWNVTNSENPELNWETYPERLEKNGVSWKVYQNEISMGNSMGDDEGSWLGNFGTNVLEYFKQYNVRLHPGSLAGLQKKKDNILQMIGEMEKQPAGEQKAQRIAAAKKVLANINSAQIKYTQENFNGLSGHQKELNNKAFKTNSNDPFYHDLTSLSYNDQGTERALKIPKGDIFHQFRQDVNNGTLPAVSWLMSPGYFSDHPGNPWFGPWYVSEVMDILLQNPEVWKKTIFILTYDENDGYFDHMAPYTVPNPYRKNTGKVSEGIDTKLDFVTKDQQTNPSASADHIRESSIGLGYRVPMIIASPWTRGGFVCSEVFDHTSSLQFLENFLEKKFNKKITEENITQWRRTICGDLTSAFRPYHGEKIDGPALLERNQFIESIHQAQFRQLPNNYKKLSAADIEHISANPLLSPLLPVQEKGIRNACPIPYELYANGHYNKESGHFELIFNAGKTFFKEYATGAPFRVYAATPYQQEMMRNWNYSVAPGDTLKDEWRIDHFENGHYHLRVYAPNGFYREFTGNGKNPLIKTDCNYESNNKNFTGNMVITIFNNDSKKHTVTISDNHYKTGNVYKTIDAGNKVNVNLNLSGSHSWYDFRIKIKGYDQFEERFAGHVETGKVSKTDPLMGGVV